MFARSRRLATARRSVIAVAVAGTLVIGGAASAAAYGVNPFGTGHDPFGTNEVGQEVNGRLLLPDNQWIAPYGQRTTFSAQTIGTAISPDGTKLAVQVGGDDSGAPSIEILDAATDSVLQHFGGNGVAAPVYSPDGSTLYTATLSSILKYTVGADGTITDPASPTTIPLPSGSFPYGLAVSPDGSTLYAALSGTNKLGVIDTTTNTLTAQIPVGNAPQDVTIVGHEAFVSNRGGRPAKAGDTTNNSDGTPIVSSPVTGASTTGTVSVVSLSTNTVTGTIGVGLQPTSMTVHDGDLFVTNTNSDTVSIVDIASRKVTQTFNVDPLPGSTVGASPNSVAFPDANHLLVSVGRDNALAEFGYSGPHTPVRYQGLIPVDWYPNEVQYDAKAGKVIVSNQQGIGTDGAPQTYAYKGTLTSFSMPSNLKLGTLTSDVFTDNAWNNLPAPHAASAPPKGGTLPAIPQQLGQPSAIKHVFLIIKENRTYDEVLGDIGKGNSDPADTDLGASITPNEHALANTFSLFDNFYDNGMLSADGHNWLLQGDANDYLEQDSASDWARSYPYPGGDALAYQSDGFIWNAAERAGKTVQNYGEYESLDSGTAGTWQQYYEDSQILEGKAAGPLPVPLNAFQSRSDVPSLNPISNPDYPLFDLNVPDQYRVDVWEQDFTKAEKTGNLPNLTIMQLPDDHTGGTPSPTAEVADNDLAVGRIVDEISHSQFWKSSAVFVLEDDTQAGDDHVDGHRGPLLVASPYANRGVINSDYYSQINVVKTIEQILGIQPMNQMDRAAVPMYSAFTNTPNDTPYNAVPNQIPLTLGVPGMSSQTTATANAIAKVDAAAGKPDTVPSPAKLLAVPAAERSVADAWATWYKTVAEPALTGPHAVADSVNPAQMNRYDWYSSTGWTKSYPGDAKILAPDQVPGRNLPAADLDG
jgi:YVTN family beta-propeller protein